MSTGRFRQGSGGGTHVQGNRGNTGNPDGGVARANRSSVRSRSGPCGMAERPVVLVKPGNAGEGKGPWVREQRWKEERTWGLARAYRPRKEFGNVRRRYMRKRRKLLTSDSKLSRWLDGLEHWRQIVDAHATRRLCRKHKVRTGKHVRFPDERLWNDLGLTRLVPRTARIPWVAL